MNFFGSTEHRIKRGTFIDDGDHFVIKVSEMGVQP